MARGPWSLRTIGVSIAKPDEQLSRLRYIGAVCRFLRANFSQIGKHTHFVHKLAVSMYHV